MNNYYGTFGWGHKHPKTKEEMKDYYVAIEAKSLKQAKSIMFITYGNFWADVYEQDKFDSEFYSKGCYSILKSMFKFKLKKKENSFEKVDDEDEFIDIYNRF